MTIPMIRGDELPPWQPSITIDGATEDYSTGHTFTVTLTLGSTTVTKTDGITGNADGSVTVTWAPDELDITPGTYRMRLTIHRTADDRDLSIDEVLFVKP